MEQCIRCQKFINQKEAYIEVREFDKGQIIKVNFMHKNCWEEMMDSKKKVAKAMGVLDKIGLKMEEMGFGSPEEMNKRIEKAYTIK